MLPTKKHDGILQLEISEGDSYIELFERQAQLTPNKDAVIFNDQTISYDQLNEHANKIANFLKLEGVDPEQCIGICMERSEKAIAAMLGILKSGAAFVPLDPDYPVARLEYIVDNAAVEIIICDGLHKSLFNTGRCIVVNEILNASKNREFSKNPQSSIIKNSSLAYVMYTSGSTGKPKGVQIENGALLTYCIADIECYRLSADDRTLQFSTLNFDIAIEEIFPPLLVGSTIVIRPDKLSNSQNELSDIISRYGVTAIHIATAYWHEWVDLMCVMEQAVPSSVRLMVVTGEKVSPIHYQRWLDRCQHQVLWCNAYGPTEATVSATVFVPSKKWFGDRMPIGRPLKGYKALILDSLGRQVTQGDIGELCIMGAALARGYLGNKKKTEEAFAEYTDADGNSNRIYKTGDLAFVLPDGNIEFCGRIDHQIKIGSYRVEPGEIESAINSHQEILESLVIAEEKDQKKFLIAYVVYRQKLIDAHELQEYLRDNIPAYMLPSRYIFLSKFPKTINGKIDRKALPDPVTGIEPRSNKFQQACTDLEIKMSTIWCDVLNLSAVSIDDNFFELGGSSILATRVITQIKKTLDAEIPVRDFFANPTIATVSRHITSMTRAEENDTSFEENQKRLNAQARKKLPEVDAFYINFEKERLFTVLYNPIEKDVSHCIIICPPFGHEYVRSHRNLQQLAIALSLVGFHVVRFDYFATGNSSGDTGEETAERWIKDIELVIKNTLATRAHKKISLLGVRMGATLAMMAESPMDIDSMVLWDPVGSGLQHLASLDRMHLNKWRQRELDISGWKISKQRSDQQLGYSIPSAKRESFESISQKAAPFAKTKNIITISTKGQTVKELVSQDSDIEYAKVDDEIFWTDHARNNSAFSSPDTQKLIVNYFMDREKNGVS